MPSTGEHTTQLVEHETRIIALEQADVEKQRRIESLEQNHGDLKLTIMEENRDTRKFMQSLIERQFNADADDRVREDSLRKERNKALTDVLIKIFGAGGIVYLLVEWAMR